MDKTDGKEPTMGHVLSPDGTEIGYWTTGEGPPLVLVHGTGSLHTTWNALLPYLTPHATTHAVDRRGRGASGDGPDYGLMREFEDVAAVVDAVAESSGVEVGLIGHSFGGLCAWGAAGLTSNIGKLVLYEGWPVVNPEVYALPAGTEQRLEALLAEGDRDALLETFYLEVAMISKEELADFRAIPGWWQERIGVAHTIPRELRTSAPLDPAQAAGITVPTMLVMGADSPNQVQADYESVAAALPDARVVILEGQQHVAHVFAPQLFAEHVFAFLRDEA